MNALMALPQPWQFRQCFEKCDRHLFKPMQGHSQLRGHRFDDGKLSGSGAMVRGICGMPQAATVREVDKVVREDISPSRSVQLRRGQKAAAVAAFLASVAGLLHLLLRALSLHDARHMPAATLM
eukprot:s965_g26.t1